MGLRQYTCFSTAHSTFVVNDLCTLPSSVILNYANCESLFSSEIMKTAVHNSTMFKGQNQGGQQFHRN